MRDSLILAWVAWAGVFFGSVGTMIAIGSFVTEDMRYGSAHLKRATDAMTHVQVLTQKMQQYQQTLEDSLAWYSTQIDRSEKLLSKIDTSILFVLQEEINELKNRKVVTHR